MPGGALAGKIAVVTGGAQGIGGGISRAMAAGPQLAMIRMGPTYQSRLVLDPAQPPLQRDDAPMPISFRAGSDGVATIHV